MDDRTKNGHNALAAMVGFYGPALGAASDEEARLHKLVEGLTAQLSRVTGELKMAKDDLVERERDCLQFARDSTTNAVAIKDRLRRLRTDETLLNEDDRSTAFDLVEGQLKFWGV